MALTTLKIHVQSCVMAQNDCICELFMKLNQNIQNIQFFMYKELIFEAKVVKLALNSPKTAAIVIFVAHLRGQKIIFGNFHDQYQKSTCLKYTFKRKFFFRFFLTWGSG